MRVARQVAAFKASVREGLVRGGVADADIVAVHVTRLPGPAPPFVFPTDENEDEDGDEARAGGAFVFSTAAPLTTGARSRSRRSGGGVRASVQMRDQSSAQQARASSARGGGGLVVQFGGRAHTGFARPGHHGGEGEGGGGGGDESSGLLGGLVTVCVVFVLVLAALMVVASKRRRLAPQSGVFATPMHTVSPEWANPSLDVTAAAPTAPHPCPARGPRCARVCGGAERGRINRSPPNRPC